MADSAAIRVAGVSKSFGTGANEVRVLKDVSLDVRQNEFFTLLGPSGCGKTTLLRLIGGFEFPDSGEILLDGENIALAPPHDRPVNTVFQSYALFPHLTVGENVSFGLEMLRRPKADVAARVGEMLRLVKMEELRDRRTDKISGGQQQRVALARALAPSPKVLLLDEPLSALDYKLRKEMQLELKRMQAETGVTFIFVTHDQEEALAMSDRIAVMSEGEVLQVGEPAEIYERPVERFVADFIGETNFLQGEILSADADKAVVRLDLGPEVSTALPEGQAPAGRVSLVARPEYARLAPLGSGDFSGTVENVVYTGTDIHFHVRLADGTLFKVRSQNTAADKPAAEAGGEVGVAIDRGAVRMLKK